MDERPESAEELTEAPVEAADEGASEAGLAEAVGEETPADESPTAEAAEIVEADAAELVSEDDAFSLPRVLEAILFASQKPVSLKELQNFCKGAAQSNPENPRVTAFAKLKEATVRSAFDQLQAGYLEAGRSFEVRETATGWQLVTRPDYAPWLRQLFPENRPARLSAPAVETLAIIAYRQPITRADIEAVRGVAVDGVMQSLLDRELVKIAGRAEVPGRPLLYETTAHFMEHFGLKSLEELPNGAELRRVKLPAAAPVEEAPAAGTGEAEAPVEGAPNAEAAPLIDETPASVEDEVSPTDGGNSEILAATAVDEPAAGEPEREDRDEQH